MGGNKCSYLDISVVGKQPDTGGRVAHKHIRATVALPLDRKLMGTQWENIISHLALSYESTYREAQQRGSSRHIRADAGDNGRTRTLFYSSKNPENV